MEAAKKHRAVTWETLNEVYIPEWVTNAYIKEGKREIPLKSYSLGKEDKSAFGDIPSEEEVRTPFHDSESFDTFISANDYSWGPRDVSDKEFEARCEEINSATRILVDSGEVQSGSVLQFKTVSNLFLQDAPLVEVVERHV